jgi:hypothetical protein
MLARSALVLGALLLGTASACVLSTPDVGGPLRELRAQQQQQADRVAIAFCAAYYDCGCEQPYPRHEDEADCVEYISTGLVARLEQGIDDELDYAPECLEANAELFEAIGCALSSDLVADLPLQGLYDEALRCHTYDGPLQLNEECTPLPTARGDECAPGLGCDPDFKMCFDTTPLAERQPCTYDGPPCDSGLLCDWSAQADQNVCLRPFESGASCIDSGFCEFDTWCDPDEFRCRPLPGPGEPCEPLLDEYGCAFGLRCDMGQCVHEAVAGQPCSEGCGPRYVCGNHDLCEDRPALVCELEQQLP